MVTAPQGIFLYIKVRIFYKESKLFHGHATPSIEKMAMALTLLFEALTKLNLKR